MFKANLKQCRNDAGLSLAQAAVAIDMEGLICDTRKVSSWEKINPPKNDLPPLLALPIIARAYRCSVEAFFKTPQENL